MKAKPQPVLECPPQKQVCIRNQMTRVPRVQVFNTEPSRTKQSFREESNINNIMAKYARTGIVEHGNRHAPSYGEVPAVDFKQALELVMAAEQSFAELPALVRRRFENDPANFLAFCEDPANRDEAGTLGLLNLIEPQAAPEPPAEGSPPPAPPA